MLLCGTGVLGCSRYKCDECGDIMCVNHRCHCRLCNSCGKPASDKRIDQLFSRRPSHLHYYHLFFTIPEELRDFFKKHREALHVLQFVGKEVLLHFFGKNYNCTPGFVSVIHTFGAQLNRNCHVHFMITAGGISFDKLRYISIKGQYLPYYALKEAWKKVLIFNIRQRAKRNIHPNEFLEFRDLLKFLQEQKDPKDEDKDKSRFVGCSKKVTSHEIVLSYLGRYLKRPIIGESRILDYNGTEVTFEYKDKYDKKTKNKVVDSLEFIGLLTQHIPSKNFKMISYGGIFANRCKEKYLKIIYTTFANTGRTPPVSKIPLNFRQRMIAFTGRDPFICKCGGMFQLKSIDFLCKDGCMVTIDIDTG